MLNLNTLLVGASPRIEALREYLPKVARANVSVLITGETGTGKECAAQAIHSLSPRGGGAFVVVNCAALPDGLIESELFGHLRGAFTGAHASARGAVAHAHGGTLFLDEIGELPMYAQAKLLRVLETHVVQPLGSTSSEAVDIRVVAATNRDLHQEMAAKRFRSDLYYRLNVVGLTLPPLRERPADIAMLADHVIAEFNRRDDSAVTGLAPALLDCMQAHDWPGNVRELRNVVESAFVDPPRGPLNVEHLAPELRDLFGQYRAPRQSERERIIAVLRRHHWNKAEAAKELHCSRMTLYRRLARYQVPDPD